MVMGIRGADGAGIPGPPGPPGPPGQVGVNTALAVFARAVLPPPPAWMAGQWSVLNFDVLETDTHQAVEIGPIWQWHAPFRGTYDLSCALCLENIPPGTPTWAMRVMRQGMEEVYAEFTGYTGQIHWLGLLNPSETLQVQIQPLGLTPVQVRGGPPRSSIVVAGVGVPA